MMPLLTTFPSRGESAKARARLDALSLPYDVVSPDPGFRRVGAPALVLERDAWAALAASRDVVCSGWVDYREAGTEVPCEEPPRFEDDAFGEAAIVVLAPCVADTTRIRIIAHLTGDLTEAFPYLNAEVREACYNVHGPTFTFMDGYRMISVYPRRIAVAKADEIVDAWRTLEAIRVRANQVWARRGEIEPCYEMRERPPALEILRRLPRTNCRACGERTCLAFAVKVWSGETDVSLCKPAFDGGYSHLKDPLVEICSGLGVSHGWARSATT